jgi:autotransporter-associated beta strand protein
MMKTAGFRKVLVVALVGILCGVGTGRAGTRTWTGMGGDNKWGTAGNWVEGTPASGDSLVFDGNIGLIASNTFAVGTAFSNITFTSSAGSFTLKGNRFALVGEIANNSTSLQVLALNFSSSSTAIVNTASGDITASNVISGACVLYKRGDGKLTLAGNNTYTVGTTIAGGTLSVNRDTNNLHQLGALSATCKLTFSGGALEVTGGALYGSGKNWLLRNVILGAGGGTIVSPLEVGHEDFAASSGLDSFVAGGTVSNGLTLKGGDIVIRPGAQNTLGKLTVFSGRAFLRNDVTGNAYPLAASDEVLVNTGAFLIFTDNMPRSINNAMTFAPDSVLCTRLFGSVGAMTLSTANAHFPSASRMFFNYDDQVTDTITINGAYPELTGDMTFQIGGLNTTVGAVTLNGPISGPYAIAKTSSGTLILNSTNSYSGGTTVNTGLLDVRKDGGLGRGDVTVLSGATNKLSSGITHDYIANSAAVRLSGAAVMNLAFTGTDTVQALSLDGGATFQASGTWGSTSSSAAHKDSHFTGTGLLNVMPDTVTTIESSANPSTFGHSIAFTATVAIASMGAGTPTGTVQFKTNTVNFGSAVTLTGGIAFSSVLPPTFPVGVYTVTAAYNPGGSFNASTGTVSGGQIVYPVPLPSGVIHLPLFEGATIGVTQPTWPNQAYWVNGTGNDQYAQWTLESGAGINRTTAAVARPGPNAMGASSDYVQALRVYYFPVLSNTQYSISFYYKAMGPGFSGLIGPGVSEMQLQVLETPNRDGGAWLSTAGTSYRAAAANWTRALYTFTTTTGTCYVCLKFGMLFGDGNRTNSTDVFYLDDDHEAPPSLGVLIRIH